MGFVWVGMEVNPQRHIIPQGLETVNMGICGSECTENGILAEGVTIFANMLHGHLLATQMSLRHIRDGVELEPIDENEHYDFNYQQMTIIPGQKKLMRGDRMIMSCQYNSKSRISMTYGGGESTDEVLYILHKSMCHRYRYTSIPWFFSIP